jgi:hypothetical protein
MLGVCFLLFKNRQADFIEITNGPNYLLPIDQPLLTSSKSASITSSSFAALP